MSANAPTVSPSAAPLTRQGPRLHVAFPEVRSYPLEVEAPGLSLDRAFFETVLSMPNPTAARDQHARIERRPSAAPGDGAALWLVEAGGPSGTWLHGERVDRGAAAALTEGAVLRIGSVVMVYREGSHLVDVPHTRSLGELTAAGLRQSYVGPFSLPSLARQIEALRGNEGAKRLVTLQGDARSGALPIARWIAETQRPGGPFALHAAGAADGGALLLPEGGSLFIEEIGGLSLEAQRALLRFVETGRVQPKEGTAPREIDVTVIAGGVLLEGAAARTPFDPALRARLGEAVVRLPTMAERPEDVGALVVQLLSLRGSAVDVEAQAIEALVRHGFPGGLPELADAVEGAVRKTGKLTKSSLPGPLAGEG